jgi:dihydroorotase-like cyclic amidohydrolase
MKSYDLIVKGGNVVFPFLGVKRADIGIVGEKIATIAEALSSDSAETVIDAKGQFVFPGAIDSHFHVGIYRPFQDDAVSESTSAISGGVTTTLAYFRTGTHYLNKTGPYREIFPEVLELSRKSFLTDYGFSLALLTEEHLKEVEWLVRECGVSTFKFYTIFRSLNLAGDSSDASNYLMTKDPVDLGFLYRYMKEIQRVNSLLRPSGKIRLSVHCEDPDIIRVSTEETKKRGTGNLLRDYSDARPGWSEAVAIREVRAVARRTGCPVNLVHLSSRDAIEAVREGLSGDSGMDIVREGTLHHLSLSHDRDYGLLGKINPPIRNREDVDFLWKSLIAGAIDTVASDTSSITKALKQGDLWTCQPGFSSVAMMFPVLITEGYHKRGLSLQRIAELTSFNPAVHYNLYPKKGNLMVGSDADLAVVDIDEEREIDAAMLHSAQDFTPYEGLRFKGWPQCTVLRGKVLFEKGQITGKPGYGRYIRRPVALSGSENGIAHRTEGAA